MLKYRIVALFLSVCLPDTGQIYVLLVQRKKKTLVQVKFKTNYANKKIFQRKHFWSQNIMLLMSEIISVIYQRQCILKTKIISKEA